MARPGLVARFVGTSWRDTRADTVSPVMTHRISAVEAVGAPHDVGAVAPALTRRLLPTPPQPVRHRRTKQLPFIQLRVVAAALECPVRRVRQFLQLTGPDLRRRDEIEDALRDEDRGDDLR